MSTEPNREEAITDAATIIDLSEKPGDRIGHYKLLEKLGEGGMGVVYLAEQEQPVWRKVALKIIKLGMDTKSVIARFEAERQALALMDHPNIAKVFDAGATETGRPFFVMELVRGVPITEYCDKNHLSARERLGLFLPVCQAIQHAHQKGIIHRDLKPSNVLVTLLDGRPIPMVIDFGIAKATHQKLTEKTLFTNLGQLIGTPAYMSPEQAEMSKLDVDTRSDIYSLGVLLYELLTGTTPFPEKRLRSAGFGEMQRIIAEEEPERPSTRLSTMENEQRTTVARNRSMEVSALGRLLRGDLDWIAMKCLEKDRTRRYETVNGLEADIQRHLSNEPITARPPSAAYRFQKMVRRNKLAFVAAAAVVTALLTGLGTSTWMFFREREAHQRAVNSEREQSRLRKQAETARTNEFKAKQEGARIALRALETLLKHNVGEDPETLRLGNHLAGFLLDQGDYTNAAQIYHGLLVTQKRVLGPEHADTLSTMNGLARVDFVQGRYDQAGALYREKVQIQTRVLGPEHPDTLFSRSGLASVFGAQGNYAEAGTQFSQVIEIQRRVLGPEHPNTLFSMNGLANVHHARGMYAEAAALHAEVLKIQQRVLGPEHPDTLSSLNRLAWSYATAKNAAFRNGAEAIKLATAACSSDGWKRAEFVDTLAAAYAERNQWDKAIVAEQKAISLLSPEQEKNRLLVGFQTRLRLYERREKFRE